MSKICPRQWKTFQNTLFACTGSLGEDLPNLNLNSTPARPWLEDIKGKKQTDIQTSLLFYTDCHLIWWKESRARADNRKLLWKCIYPSIHSYLYLYTYNYQASKGIRQWPINWDVYPQWWHTKLPLLIDGCNDWEPTIQNSQKPLKLLSQPTRICYYKLWGLV